MELADGHFAASDCVGLTQRGREGCSGCFTKIMKHPFRLHRHKGGVYYIHDSQSGKQASLGTRDRREATELFSARLQAHRQAHLNLQLARTYLTATDPMVARRTWQDVMNVCVKISHDG